MSSQLARDEGDIATTVNDHGEEKLNNVWIITDNILIEDFSLLEHIV